MFITSVDCVNYRTLDGINYRWYKFKEVTALDGLKKASKRQK